MFHGKTVITRKKKPPFYKVNLINYLPNDLYLSKTETISCSNSKFFIQMDNDLYQDQWVLFYLIIDSDMCLGDRVV